MKNNRSEQEYRKNVIESYSIAEMCRNFGIKPCGGNYKTIHNDIKKFNIDISHFRGQGWNVGLKFKPNVSKCIDDILVENSTYQSYKLKNRLLNENIKQYICEDCRLTEWNNKSIPLELHPINGINTDNRIENLQLLCPNCHAQTKNYRGRNNLSASGETPNVELP
jgi:Zn finger protein HypA/HybF involved in hydrogenase expression